MAHASQIQFFKIALAAFADLFSGRVLDVGSLDINGGPHELLNPIEYVGVDLAEGPNVDLVARGEELDFPTGSFDLSMSSECFEHNPCWQPTLVNMVRMTRRGGLIVFSCATTGRPEHGTTRSDGGFSAPLAVGQGQEHYANVTPRQVATVLNGVPLAGHFMQVNRSNYDLFFVGLKEGASRGDLDSLRSLKVSAENLFGRNRYPGRLPRRLAIQLLGDACARIYDTARHRSSA